jgi:hypothetical protein
MKIFCADPDAALQAAQADLQAAERRIGELQIERAAAIEEAEGGEYINAVTKFDAELVRLRASVGAHRDRVTAMEAKHRRLALARREEEKAAFIGKLKAALPRRQAAVERLDGALKEAAEGFKELAAADEAIFVNWPDVMPPADRFSYLRADRIPALSPMRKHRPMSAGLIRELVNHVPFDFAAEVEKRSRELIEELEGPPASIADREVA